MNHKTCYKIFVRPDYTAFFYSFTFFDFISVKRDNETNKNLISHFFGKMVRYYVQKTERQTWASESMVKAISLVLNTEMGYKKAAKQFSVPQTTLKRYLKRKIKMPIS